MTNATENGTQREKLTLTDGTVNSTITVTSPNGGEDWVSGQTKTIQWNANFTGGTLKIELYKSNKYVSTITASTSNDGQYTWAIPASTKAGSTYKIKITSVSDSDINDQSNANFTISDPQLSVTITSPNGGEVFKEGCCDLPFFEVRWESVDTGEQLRIYLTKTTGPIRNTDSGTSFLLGTVKNDGFSQYVPLRRDLNADNDYKIQIRDSKFELLDESDGFFTIEPDVDSGRQLKVIYPNGGESLVVGTSVSISYSGGPSFIGCMSPRNDHCLKFYLNDTLYAKQFIVPNSPGGGYRITIKEGNTHGTPDIDNEDSSDNTFSIVSE